MHGRQAQNARTDSRKTFNELDFPLGGLGEEELRHLTVEARPHRRCERVVGEEWGRVFQRPSLPAVDLDGMRWKRFREDEG